MSRSKRSKLVRTASRVSREWADVLLPDDCSNYSDPKTLSAIVDRALIKKPKFDRPTAIITFGYPGSGKSTMINTLLGDDIGKFVQIDIDSIITQLPPFRDNLTIPIKSSKLKKIKRTVGSTRIFKNCLQLGWSLVNRIFNQVIKKRHNILYDLPQINFNHYSELKLHNYNIVFVYITRPNTEYARILKNRAIKTGRSTYGTTTPTVNMINSSKKWEAYRIALIARVFTKQFFVCYNSPKMNIAKGMVKKVKKLDIKQPRGHRRAKYYSFDPADFTTAEMIKVLI